MKLFDILTEKDEIIKIAKKFGFTNVRVTRNIGGKLNLVIDEDPILVNKLPFEQSGLFAKYLSSFFQCDIEIFERNEMGINVVNLDKSLEEVIKEVTQLFQNSPQNIHINKTPVNFSSFFPAVQKKINDILNTTEESKSTMVSKNTSPTSFQS